MNYLAQKTPILKLKVYKSLLSVVLLGTLSSCQASNTTASESKVDENAQKFTAFPSVLTLFSCKPDAAAFVAAHRGTHEDSQYPENTLESLKALHDQNIQFAEIDVARLKDGTLILWHDGTWNRNSTGKGPIASTTYDQSQKLLNKTTNGNLTTYRPSKFEDVLRWAKDKIYLEIDFKSSVTPANVIKQIENANMLDQVILISYDTEQAIELHKLAPTAALSVGIRKPGDIKALEVAGISKSVMTAWTGRGGNKQTIETLRANNIPILAGSFFDLDDKLQQSQVFDYYIDFAENTDLVVSDYAFDTQPALTFTAAQQASFNECLANSK